MAKTIQTAVRLTKKEKSDVEALAARWGMGQQDIIQMAIAKYIGDNCEATQKGYEILKLRERIRNEQTSPVSRKSPRG